MYKKKPIDQHLKPGPPSIWGPKGTLAIAATVRDELVRLVADLPVSAVARWAYVLGRGPLLSRLAAEDRWDREHRSTLGPLVSVAWPLSWLHGWPLLRCSHATACRLAIDVGVALLRAEHAATGRCVVLDERTHDPFSPAYHPDRYVFTTSGLSTSGRTWIG